MKNQKPQHWLNSIYLYVTDRCNLRCGHCWIMPHYQPEARGHRAIKLKYLKHAFVEAKGIGLGNVKLTGGEPFLRKDILDIISFLSYHNIEVDIETNGTLLDEKIIKFLKENKVNQISVSLDAASEDIHDSIRGVRGSFKKTYNNLLLLKKYGINTQIIMTLHQGNVHEIEGLLRLADEARVDSLKINPLIPCGRGLEYFGRRANLSASDLIHLDRWIEHDICSKYQTPTYFDIPIALRSLHYIKEGDSCECNILNIIGILHNGDVSICGIGSVENGLIMGNITQDSLSEIWDNATILKKLREDLPKRLKGICGRCIFKFRCLGACRANAYALTGDLNAPYFLCEQAYEASIFPESRLIN